MSKSEGTVKMRVEVTQADIDKGIKRFAGGCAISLALRRLGFTATVGTDSCHLGTRGAWIRMPEKACEFVSLFDAGKNPHPITFELDVPLSAMVTA